LGMRRWLIRYVVITNLRCVVDPRVAFEPKT